MLNFFRLVNWYRQYLPIQASRVSVCFVERCALWDCFPSSSCLLLHEYWNFVPNSNNIPVKETKIWLSFKTWCSLSVPRCTASNKRNWNSWCLYLHATLLHSCHGVFIGRFTFRSNFPGMRLSWECHDQSQETNGAGATFLSRKKRYTKNRSVCKNGSCMLLLIGSWW